MDSEGFFFPSPSFANLVELAANAGLRLNRLTVHNTGDYSVTVSTHRGSRYDAFTLTAHVIVADTPTTVTGRLDISQRADVAVYDNRTREWHIQLTCGDFRRLGQPHVQLEWTTPMGVGNTTQSDDGRFFRLLLPNPVVGGNYSCRLHPDSPAARCFYPGHPLLTGDSVHVDETEATFALMRAEQQYLLSENQALHREVDELRRQVEWLMANVGHFTTGSGWGPYTAGNDEPNTETPAEGSQIVLIDKSDMEDMAEDSLLVP